MATVALRIAGTVLGGVFGPVGAAIGGAVGALAGATIDNALINSTRHLEGARLSGARPMSADAGHAVPRAFGYCRVPGSVIWATQLLETATTTRAGGKGGPKQTEYAYSCSFAVAVCEGPVNMIKRIWADGKELDLRDITYRSYLGTETQQPDPLMEAKQGGDNCPAYRGIAYVVFEDFALSRFGNRVPSFSFEVVRAVGALEEKIKAVCLIPGSTEYGLSPTVVTQSDPVNGTLELNRHMLHGETDYSASMDELQALCPNLAHVSVVVTWFGNDLRVGACTIRPGVTQRELPGVDEAWSVAGLTRTSPETHVCSRTNGRSNYGGTPTDASMRAIIADLKSRGLKVTLNPFVMMDVPPGNQLPDPWGKAEQAPHPWRGRISCIPAPGLPGSPYNSAVIASQCAAFVGNATSGGDTEFSYRRFILHYAELAHDAGGVDSFLIGSELRGLTSLRDGSRFVFVDALVALADDIRAIVGAQTKLSYGADWSEYFGVQAPDGSGDLYYNLDPLWASEAISAIGIDNYMPLMDWRDEDAYAVGANPDGALSAADKAAMAAALTSGEGYDWYYASDQDRALRQRTPITDGAYNQPWVYRYKDLYNWWSNRHYDRVGGVQAAQPSPWVPQSKPFWFTEVGSPAIDRGANQPNVFADPKSSENAWPYFSRGSRDDAVQRAFLDVHMDAAKADRTYNPRSDDGRFLMIDPERIYLWAWDARPYPAFPLSGDVWGDGENWLRGHWLNGRLGGVPIIEWMAQTAACYGLDAPIQVPASAVLQGVLIASQASGRAMIEPLMSAFGIVASEDVSAPAPVIAFRGADEVPRQMIEAAALIDKGEDAALVERIEQSTELPSRVAFHYRDGLQSHLINIAQSRRLSDGDDRVTVIDLPVAADDGLMRQAAEHVLNRQRLARNKCQFSLSLRYGYLQPSDVVVFADTQNERWHIDRIDVGDTIDVAATRIGPAGANIAQPKLPLAVGAPASGGQFSGPPATAFLDLPCWDGADPASQFRLAAMSRPLRTQSVHLSTQDSDYSLSGEHSGNSIIATLVHDITPAPSGRLYRGAAIEIDIARGELSSRSMNQMLAGGNALAVKSQSGEWEIIQYQLAEEISAQRWRLTNLLRGQAGTEDVAAVGALSGAEVVLLDATLKPLNLPTNARGMTRHWRVGPQGKEFSDRYFAHEIVAGGTRAFLPLSPVHLRVAGSRQTGLQLRWIRRSRIDADSWLGVDVPLGEAREAYLIVITDPGGNRLASRSVSEPVLDLSATQAWPATIRVSITQISESHGPGLPLDRQLTLQ
ncbi:MAG: glycoside hydrolase/phage tail family protein [Ahrensia sp.]